MTVAPVDTSVLEELMVEKLYPRCKGFCSWLMYSSKNAKHYSSLDQFGRACFADLQFLNAYTTGNKVKCDIILANPRFYRGKPNKRQTVRYMDWVLNRSPFSDIFLLHDPEFAFNYGMAVDLSLYPATRTFHGMQAFRLFHEYSESSFYWDTMVKECKGNENKAFVLSQFTCGSCRESQKVSLTTPYGGHSTLNISSFTKEAYNNLVEGHFVPERQADMPMYLEPDYRGTERVFCPPERSGIEDSSLRFSIKSADMWGGRKILVPGEIFKEFKKQTGVE